MVVNSVGFLLFVCVVLLFYYMIPTRFQYVVLLLASYGFYLLAGVGNIGYLLLATGVTWIAACLLEKCMVKGHKKQKQLLILSVCMILSLLFYAKYMDFVMERFVYGIFLRKRQMPDFFASIIAPLGISYFTLQAIGYLIDVSKGKVCAQKNPFKVGLFLSYFPQITQGPIGRYKDLGAQLFQERAFDYTNFCLGWQRILLGFFKKTLIADRFSPFVKNIFANYTEYSGTTIILGCIYMTLQVYADFSGYMDIVCGVSDLFGIKLKENFKTPFFSTSLAEYWRCWHITLSSWFRDYIFYPLSISKRAVRLGKGARKHLPIRIAKLIPAIYAMAAVWFATGVWHDASIRYILWGVANGAVMISSMCLEPVYEKAKGFLHIKKDSRGFRYFQIIRTFLLVSLLKVFPAAGSTKESLALIRKIVTDVSLSFERQVWIPDFALSSLVFVMYGLLVFGIISFAEHHQNGILHVQLWFMKQRAWIRIPIYVLLLTSVLLLGKFGGDMIGGFEYAQY